MASDALEKMRGGLIVSCQAERQSPLGEPAILAALAQAAVAGGAVGIRANGPENLAAICAVVSVPVIGIYKVARPGSDVYITPMAADAQVIVAAANPSPEIIAFDATERERWGGANWRETMRYIQWDAKALAMADIATLEEGLAAAEAGADIVATTLSGYTAETAFKQATGGPDLALVRALAERTATPIICEGRVHSPALAKAALEAGAWAVVVGTAITAIDWVTRRYIDEMQA